MSRRRVAEKRDVLPDPKFGSKILTQFINVVMERGKKSVAEKIVYGALDKIQADTKKDSLPLFEMAVSNVRPIVEVKSRRVGGATYQVPIEVKSSRQSTLAMRWIVDAARKRTEMSMPHRLAGELQDSASKRGNAIKKREDTHRMAEANRAFSHYRW